MAHSDWCKPITGSNETFCRAQTTSCKSQGGRAFSFITDTYLAAVAQRASCCSLTTFARDYILPGFLQSGTIKDIFNFVSNFKHFTCCQGNKVFCKKLYLIKVLSSLWNNSSTALIVFYKGTKNLPVMWRIYCWSKRKSLGHPPLHPSYSLLGYEGYKPWRHMPEKPPKQLQKPKQIFKKEKNQKNRRALWCCFAENCLLLICFMHTFIV